MRNYSLSKRSDVTDLHDKLEAALRVALADSNVRLPSGGRLSYDPGTGEVTLKVALRVDRVAADGTVKTAEELTFERQAIIDGVPLDLLGRHVILLDGITYRVMGAVSRHSEKTYVIRRARDGKNFMCSAHALKCAKPVAA
jgi:hypothetical protein